MSLNDAVRDALIIAAADLWSGAEPSEVASSEYFQGQVDLIANSAGGYSGSDDDPRPGIKREILIRLK